MSISFNNNTSDNTGSAPTDFVEATVDNATSTEFKNGYQEAPSSRINNLFDALRASYHISSLSKDGLAYVETLKECINNINASQNTIIKTADLSSPENTLIIYDDKSAVGLVFEESAANFDHSAERVRPVIDCRKKLREAFNIRFGNTLELINIVVVTPEDYPRVNQMACYLTQFLCAYNTESTILSANYFFKNKKNTFLQISTNPEDYALCIDRYSPHGVPARADITLTFQMVERNYDNSISGGQRTPQVSVIPFAAVGAYVTFRDAERGEPIRIPEIHISEIVTSFQSFYLIPILTTYAAHELLFGSPEPLWFRQFTSLGNENENLGALYTTSNPTTQKEELGIINDQNKIMIMLNKMNNTFFDTYTHQLRPQEISPRLYVDFVEGRAVIAGWREFAGSLDMEPVTKITEYWNDFIGSTDKSTDLIENGYIANPVYKEIIGKFKKGAITFDSRNLSYLTLVNHYPTNWENFLFLLRYQDPITRFTSLRDYSHELIAPLYYLNASAIDPFLIECVYDVMYRSIPINTQQSSRSCNINWGYGTARINQRYYNANNIRNGRNSFGYNNWDPYTR